MGLVAHVQPNRQVPTTGHHVGLADLGNGQQLRDRLGEGTVLGDLDADEHLHAEPERGRIDVDPVAADHTLASSRSSRSLMAPADMPTWRASERIEVRASPCRRSSSCRSTGSRLEGDCAVMRA